MAYLALWRKTYWNSEEMFVVGQEGSNDRVGIRR